MLLVCFPMRSSADKRCECDLLDDCPDLQGPEHRLCRRGMGARNLLYGICRHP
jgi:hypothetical protein